MISREDVMGLSVCTPGLLGGVSPAPISETDLPQRRDLVPVCPAAPEGPGGPSDSGGPMGRDCVETLGVTPQLSASARPGC